MAHLHLHKRLDFNLFSQHFPRDIAENHVLGEEESADLIRILYEGLARDERPWLAYDDPDSMLPLTFNPFDEALDRDNEAMMAIVTPRAIPVNFFGSTKTSPQTYEFYNPSALARQLAFGQLPIALPYADVIKPRETINNFLEWSRVAQLPPNTDTDVDLSEWVPAAFITQAYKLWWAEWKEHLFCRSA